MEASKHFDVIVIGAGPAGAMAAIEVAKAGRSVAIVEKVSLPRRKVCAGGLVKRAVKLLHDIPFPIEQQCHAIEMHTNDANTQFRQESENLVTMVCRSSFDMALIKNAVRCGAKLFDKTTVSEISPEKGCVKVQTTQESFSCSYLIFAEGAMAKLSNQFWHEDRLLLPSLEADIYPNAEYMDNKKHHAVFDFGIIQGGYGWIFPKGDHFSVGLAVMNKQHNIKLQPSFDQYLQQLGLENAKVVNRKGFIIPLSPRKQPMMQGRMMLVGDTAGLADPITAEGLTHAIQSGIGAGRAIATHFSDPVAVANTYTENTIQPILDELKVARLMAKIIYHPNTMWRNLLFKHYGDRLCKGMADLIEGKRTYASSLKKHQFLNAIIQKVAKV